MSQTHSRNQVILAPSREVHLGVMSVFLAGTTTPTAERDWREVLIEYLADQPVTVINPYRPDWDSSWREEITCQPYREQVQWELDMQENADIIVFYFHPNTDAPISLLELGLAASTKKPIVLCPEGYKKRGNVQLVCQHYELETADSLEAVKQAIVNRLPDNSR
ncbi:hypothetical protein F4821DRAFT_264622 [Hypoxylon rubiginosum]|uniref:Uncharacterized protein n=1 Tax=Hypoxylon rubiginosum TaxID=110542 RepID=A0ACC0CMU7_9PEZI|nr:hypothetical protein F4821DRAFT_264622 [Hypoxylon rubiginosum]